MNKYNKNRKKLKVQNYFNLKLIKRKYKMYLILNIFNLEIIKN